jgi:hypothetical protein
VPLEADSREFGARHYPVMVVLHTGLLAGYLLEVIALRRRSIGRLGWPILAVVLAAPGGAVVVHLARDRRRSRMRTCPPSPPWGGRGIPVLLHARRWTGSNKNGHKGANAKVRKMIRAWNPVALFRGVQPSVTVRADERSIPARAYLVVVAEHMVRRLPDPRLIPSPG